MKSRVLLVTVALIALFCFPVQAHDDEDTRHEIAISYGVEPNTFWLDMYTDVIKAEFGETLDGEKYVGPIGLEYYYHTSPLLGVGAVAVLATNHQNGFRNNVQSSHTTRTYFSFMPSVKLNWLRKHNWGLYSKVAAGATYIRFAQDDYDDNGKKTNEKRTVNDLMFNFQASLIGIEAGGQNVRGFIELGVGEQGVALAGVRCKF